MSQHGPRLLSPYSTDLLLTKMTTRHTKPLHSRAADVKENYNGRRPEKHQRSVTYHDTHGSKTTPTTHSIPRRPLWNGTLDRLASNRNGLVQEARRTHSGIGGRCGNSVTTVASRDSTTTLNPCGTTEWRVICSNVSCCNACGGPFPTCGHKHAVVWNTSPCRCKTISWPFPLGRETNKPNTLALPP